MHTHTCKRTRISFTCEICFSVIPGIVLRRSSASRHRSSKIIGFDVSFILGIESKKATTKNEHMCLIIIIVCVMISIFECYTKILFLRKWIMVMLYDVKSASMFSAISEECSIFCSSSNWSILLLSVLRLSKLRLLSTSFLDPKMNAQIGKWKISTILPHTRKAG